MTGAPRVREVRAFVVRGGGGDYHDQAVTMGLTYKFGS